MGMSGDTALALAKSYVKKTLQGQGALKGQDGFSPTVKENQSNTDNDYRLDITDKNGTITTPNLKGSDGSGSDYKQLKNKPSIGGVEIDGNKTLDDLGIQPKGEYLTEETDPTVPQWAKENTKPTYTASEVGADRAGSADMALSDAKEYTDNKIAELINGAPETMDTLKEIADALKTEQSTVEVLQEAIGTKLNKDGDSKDNTVTFVQSETRENIDSGDKHSVLFGKIRKWLFDLKEVAFSGSYTDLSNKPSAADIGALPKDGNATSATKATNDGDGNNIAETYATKEELNRKLGTVYSFHINGNESSPSDAVTYLDDAVGMTPSYMDFVNDKFNYGSWGNAFFMPKPCMLKYDGTLDYYLDPNDYSKKIDGTASDISDMSYEGNAMIEWGAGGKIWYKIIPDGNDQSSATISFANAQMDSDYVDWSFHNYNGNVVDRFYTPIYSGSTDGTRLRSMSGQVCIQNKTAQQEIDLAKANNVDGNSIWYTEILSDIQLVNLLLVLIGKSLDTQSVFGRGNDSGHVNDSSQNYGMLNSGTMDAKGMFWGSNDGTSGVKVFGMENWWGNQWRRYTGDINDNGVHKVKYTYGTEDRSTEIGFNTTGQGYKVTNEALQSTSGGYIQKMKFAENGMSPLTASGTSSTYYCDGLWTNNAQVNYAMRGGSCGVGAHCGAFALGLDSTPTASWWSYGASLSCKPLA